MSSLGNYIMMLLLPHPSLYSSPSTLLILPDVLIEEILVQVQGQGQAHDKTSGCRCVEDGLTFASPLP
jgi:hypothetical protein